MKNILNKRLTALVLLVFGFLANAQTPPPPPEGTEGDIGGISQPIDGYVLWLLIVGVVFIAATIRMKSKQIKSL